MLFSYFSTEKAMECPCCCKIVPIPLPKASHSTTNPSWKLGSCKSRAIALKEANASLVNREELLLSMSQRGYNLAIRINLR